MKKRKKILVAPLDWGLGHATRCIPIIRYLIANNYEVIIAASGDSKKIIQEQFPTLKYLHLDGYEVTYKEKNFKFHFISQLPKIFYAIRKEHQWLEKAIKKHQLDLVISDNRYGLYSKQIPCVLITHQLNIQVPKQAKKITLELVNSFIKKFTQCWVPDYEGKNNLAGKLSHKTNRSKKIKYLGPLSRFEKISTIPTNPTYEYLALVSGPENQRTLFERKLIKFLLKTNKKSLLICGLPQENFQEKIENITRISHLRSDEFLGAISASKTIICRSGYSTIMDLITLQRGAILIPTPEQTEQEYLAKHLDEKFGFRAFNQKKLLSKPILHIELPTTYVDLPTNNMVVVQSFLDEFLNS